jgi:hypothetical protein
MGLEETNGGLGGEPLRKEEVVRANPEPAGSLKPYQKPEFRFERVFETMALACGKMSATQSHCRFNRQNS